jgi:hypothetical protein
MAGERRSCVRRKLLVRLAIETQTAKTAGSQISRYQRLQLNNREKSGVDADPIASSFNPSK